VRQDLDTGTHVFKTGDFYAALNHDFAIKHNEGLKIKIFKILLESKMQADSNLPFPSERLKRRER